MAQLWFYTGNISNTYLVLLIQISAKRVSGAEVHNWSGTKVQTQARWQKVKEKKQVSAAQENQGQSRSGFSVGPRLGKDIAEVMQGAIIYKVVHNKGK